MDAKRFAERLETARKAKKLSQEELGKAVGLSRYPVMDWEAHRKTPDIQMASRLAECLGVSLLFLLGETDDPTSTSSDASSLNRTYSSIDEASHPKMHNIENLTWIPVVSPEVKVSAGAGNCCEEIVWNEIDRFPLFDGKIAALYSDNGLLSIYVEGDSMEPQIHDGDLVIFKKSHEWVSGNIVVVCLDGRLMVKGIVKGPEGEIRLRSLNKAYEDIIIGKASFFLVYGRVLKIVRQWDPKPVL
ncbi:MAG: helix-turn-helix domain-containing protein [Verrucomicrobiae bacterium]|nr:helix-turn-helix domain-containing protein [Verrucomicrobiae bacterium]